MARYIPPNDAEFLAWMNNFISVETVSVGG
jgi:hypothetical protein